ncbi:Hypothetical predicted protein [Pelobates cultripes]|uniref:Uncharacterized protein n=1 Tax=Pelobates cultripes TaxID=61616 RepID=A0AAD1T3K5_PELCU|nr:Hypothetical predicted protein [Pelobates cultripes]
MPAGMHEPRLGAYTTLSRGETDALPVHKRTQHPRYSATPLSGLVGINPVPNVPIHTPLWTPKAGTSPNHVPCLQAARHSKIADAQPNGVYVHPEHSFSTNKPLINR